MPYDPTFVDILTAGTDDQARQQAQIMAQQLRGDKTLGMLGQIGGKRAAGLGKEMLNDSDMAEKGLLSSVVNRLHYGQQAQDLKTQLAQAGMEKALAVQEARNKGMLDVASLRALAAGGKTGDKEEADHYKKFIEFTNKNNPYQQSGRNPLGLRQNLLGQAERIQALVDSGENPNVVISSPLVREMEMGLAALGSSGASGQVAKSAVDEIANKTMPRKYSEWKAWLLNEPQSAEAQGFVKQALMTIKREHDVISRQQREGVARSAIGYRRSLFHPSNESDAVAWLKDSGYDDAEIAGLKSGKYTPSPRGGGGGAVADPFAAARAWLAANPNHADAAAVAAKIKAGGG